MKLYLSGAKKPFTHHTFEQVSQLPFDVDKIKFVSCGANHVVLVTQNNDIFAAGENAYGELGINTTSAQSQFVQWKKTDGNSGWDNVEKLICGMHSTAIITSSKVKDKNQLLVCGNNEHGLLGLGDTKSLFVPLFTIVNLPSDCDGVNLFSMGADHCMLLDQKNQLFACGLNDRGQLGLGSDQREYYSFQKVALSFNSAIQQISCGYRHTMVWTEDDKLYVCGDNTCGQLGISMNNHFLSNLTLSTISAQESDLCRSIHIKQIFAGWYHSEVLFENGVLFCCGSNSHGEIGELDLPEKNYEQFRQVNMLLSNIVIDKLCMTCPTGSTMALLNDGHTVVASGINHYYQLGLGDRTHRTDLTKVPIHQFIDEDKGDTLLQVAHGSRLSALLVGNTSTSTA